MGIMENLKKWFYKISKDDNSQFGEDGPFIEVLDLCEAVNGEFEIDILVKNRENAIQFIASITEITSHEFPVKDYDGFHLSHFNIDGEVVKFEDFELGNVLQKFFPTLYRGVQNKVIEYLSEEGLC